MGYKVMYPQFGKHRLQRQRKKPIKVQIVILTAIFLVVLIAFSVWQQGSSWLLPGDPVVTENALQEMIDGLRDGQGLAEAVTTFCREVVSGAR